MLHEIPETMKAVMRELEERDRTDHAFSKQIPPDVGRLLAILAVSSPDGAWLELGTSCGYSALWLSLACRLRDTRLVTVDRDPEKTAIAARNLSRAGVSDLVEIVETDSIDQLERSGPLGFCFVDADGGKGTYEMVVSKMKPDGLFVYDHTKERGAEIIDAALADSRVDAVLLRIASHDRRTELVCRRCG